jgi:hypothetical protein
MEISNENQDDFFDNSDQQRDLKIGLRPKG